MLQFPDDGLVQKPQPYYDIEVAKMCRWLIKNKYTCTVTQAGEVVLEKRPDRPSDVTSHYRQMLRSLR